MIFSTIVSAFTGSDRGLQAREHAARTNAVAAAQKAADETLADLRARQASEMRAAEKAAQEAREQATATAYATFVDLNREIAHEAFAAAEEPIRAWLHSPSRPLADQVHGVITHARERARNELGTDNGVSRLLPLIWARIMPQPPRLQAADQHLPTNVAADSFANATTPAARWSALLAMEAALETIAQRGEDTPEEIAAYADHAISTTRHAAIEKIRLDRNQAAQAASEAERANWIHTHLGETLLKDSDAGRKYLEYRDGMQKHGYAML